jgi:hypothetical protein
MLPMANEKKMIASSYFAKVAPVSHGQRIVATTLKLLR